MALLLLSNPEVSNARRNRTELQERFLFSLNKKLLSLIDNLLSDYFWDKGCFQDMERGKVKPQEHLLVKVNRMQVSSRTMLDIHDAAYRLTDGFTVTLDLDKLKQLNEILLVIIDVKLSPECLSGFLRLNTAISCCPYAISMES